jgi:hypothetical protein
MNNSDLEKMIAEEFLANKGRIVIDENDIKEIRGGSDFIDGAVIEGKLGDVSLLAEKAVMQIKTAHPYSTLVNLMLKLRVATGVELMMSQMTFICDLSSDLGDDILTKWGLEANAPILDEIRICVLGGFRNTII